MQHAQPSPSTRFYTVDFYYVCFGREYINNFDLSVNLYDRAPPLDSFFYSEYRDTAEINYYPSWLAF